MAMFVVEHQPYSLKYASSHLRMDRELALKAISKRGDLLGELKDDEFGAGDYFVHSEKAIGSFVDDDEAVRLAITNDGCAIRHATDRFKEDLSFCLIAIKQNVSALQYIGVGPRFSSSILDVVLKDNLFKLNKHLTASSKENRIKALEKLDLLMRDKLQSYFLETMKHACEYKLPVSDNKEFLPRVINLILDHASMDTLTLMREMKTENKILMDLVDVALDRLKILEMPQSKNADVIAVQSTIKKTKSRKVLKP